MSHKTRNALAFIWAAFVGHVQEAMIHAGRDGGYTFGVVAVATLCWVLFGVTVFASILPPCVLEPLGFNAARMMVAEEHAREGMTTPASDVVARLREKHGKEA